ncbi:MAG: Hsp20/alpha crystallin family protein [Parafilimonas sp.]
MYNRQSFAPHGAAYGRRNHPFMQSHFRAPVNVYKTENSFELMVFAPGRIKENFSVKSKGNELTISYAPPEDFKSPEWIKKEYSRGGFERTFTINESIDTSNIKASYTDGVLQVSLPIIPGAEIQPQDIPVN